MQGSGLHRDGNERLFLCEFIQGLSAKIIVNDFCQWNLLFNHCLRAEKQLVFKQVIKSVHFRHIEAGVIDFQHPAHLSNQIQRLIRDAVIVDLKHFE